MRLIALFALAITLHAQRIVSTSPSITETLFALGLGSHVVGVTTYCTHPPEAVKLPKIGTFLKPDLEAIVALHPSLVVVQKVPNQLPEQLTRLHIPFITVDQRSLADMFAMAEAIGKAAGANPAAERLNSSMRAQFEDLRRRTASRPHASVLFLIGHTPGQLEGIIASAGPSYFTELIDIAGGTNCLRELSTPYPKISLEEIIARNPDVIVEMVGHQKPQDDEIKKLWATRRTLKAVSTRHVYGVPSELFVVPGPRAVEAARYLAHLFHPEAVP